MLDAKRIVEIINQLGIKTYTFDYNVYTAYINSMFNWYKGYDPTFHSFKQYNGKDVVTVNKAQLNMAKHVCEDHTSLTFNENVSIHVNGDAEREYLLGYDEMSGALGQNRLWTIGPEMYELTCALGTGAFEVVIDDLLKIQDKVIANDASKLRIVTHNAFNIIPLSWNSSRTIKEVAFVDQYTIKNETFLELRMHVLEDGMYTIINKKLKVVGNNANYNYIVVDNCSVLDKFETGSNKPWFSILRLPIINNYDISNPMGASVYGNAIDVLKNVDDGFNILSTEYKYGTKKVFYNKSLLNRDSKGNVIIPDDINKSAFYYVGDDYNTDSDAKEPIHEFNPDLRIEEIVKGLESSLNYLSIICGLGESHYKFNNNTAKTATEVISENSSMYRNIRKNEMALEEVLISLCRIMLYANNLIHNTKFNVDVDISVEFDASIIEDNDKKRTRELNEVELGVLSIDEYKEHWYKDRRDTTEIKKVKDSSGSI